MLESVDVAGLFKSLGHFPESSSKGYLQAWLTGLDFQKGIAHKGEKNGTSS